MPKKVLVVEDDMDNRRIAVKVLTVEGYQVVEAADGVEALARVREERPDLILMDLVLPKLDGWETTRQLKADAATRSIPVVAFTAYAMRGDEEQARAAGCDDYLPKPVRPATIVEVVKKYLDGKRDAPQESYTSQRILVVDDNPDSVLIMQTMLKNQPCEVLVATGGAEALERIKNEKVDLVLLDVMMPEVSGLDVLRILKEDSKTARLPVILVTAKTHDDDLLSGYQYGADYYITKPFTAQQLLFGVNLFLGKGESVE